MKRKEIKEKQLIESERRIEKKVNSIIFPSHIDETSNNNVLISLRGINKIYGNDSQAVFDFNLDISEKEFIVFVGPSGCGKSTTLRMICGLEEISSGELYIDDTYANELPPKDRNIAMVFQSYALYPHMSVKDNLAFSLKIRKVETPLFDKGGKPILWIDKNKIRKLNRRINELNLVLNECKNDRETLKEDKTSLPEVIYKERLSFVDYREELANKEIKRLQIELEETKNTKVQKVALKHIDKKLINSKVNEAAKMLEIEQYLTRKPRALSGGQRQRVALGRAIVRDAKAFLMDEPLSNLDAKLRVQMRAELVSLHRKMNATTIYVTHDQTEAMTMADRIVVMKDGVVQQIDSPKNIFNNPRNLFVATFIGSPAMNALNAKYNKGTITLGNGYSFTLSKEKQDNIISYYKKEIQRLTELNKNLEIALLEEKDKNHHIYELAKSRCLEIKSIYESRLKENFDFIYGIRPEYAKVNEGNGFKMKCDVVELLGSEYIIHGKIGEQEVVIKANNSLDIENNDVIEVGFDFNLDHGFDKDTQFSIF